jgi:hypothetical protein
VGLARWGDRDTRLLRRLVQRRGWTTEPQQIAFEGIDVTFVTHTIRHYMSHPERRAAIGTPWELDRLQGALTAETAAATADMAPDRSVFEPGTSRTGVIVALLTITGGAVLSSTAVVPGWMQLCGDAAAVAPPSSSPAASTY